MLWLRLHADDSQDNSTDDSGRSYTTIPTVLADKYVDQARRDGEDLNISGGSGVSSGDKIDILVTDTDSIGLETPTRRHAPGY
jgi:hypothetical protein